MIATHLRARARRKLQPQLPRLPPLRRSKSRLQRKRPVRNPRRSKRRRRALTLVTKAKAKKSLKTARSNPPQTLVQMMNKRKQNPKSDLELTVGLFLNS